MPTKPPLQKNAETVSLPMPKKPRFLQPYRFWELLRTSIRTIEKNADSINETENQITRKEKKSELEKKKKKLGKKKKKNL